MHAHRLLLAAVGLVFAGQAAVGQSTDAQTTVAQPADAQSTAAAPEGPIGLPMVEIEKLVAPIALYPDVLVSQILPAATFPTDVVMASRWCKEHPDLKDLDNQQWDLSVISVCRYPQVLDKLNGDLDWTNALGAAFLDQPEDVMAAIQSLRKMAQSSGVLQNTPQQTVVVEQETVRIVPAEKEVVYVPQYDPQVIYVEDDDDDGLAVAGAITAGALSFGAGLAMGCWLDNDCDWGHGCVVGCRPGYWGGWGYHGAAHWDNDWVAARGPRRGFVAGENGGAYVGPRGAAIWGENGHGAAWGRSGGRVGGPTYGGRYSNYSNYGGGNFSGNRRNVASGNTINVNQNNVNIDRGDRTNVRGGDRANVGTGDRTRVGGDRTNVGGDRTNVSGGDRSRVGLNQPNAGGGSRDSARPENRSALNDRQNGSELNKSRERGQASRDTAKRPGGDGARPAADRPQRSPDASRPSGDHKSSSMGDRRGGSEVKKSSSRGSSSRGGGGGGGRGGGGGGRRSDQQRLEATNPL